MAFFKLYSAGPGGTFPPKARRAFKRIAQQVGVASYSEATAGYYPCSDECPVFFFECNQSLLSIMGVVHFQLGATQARSLSTIASLPPLEKLYVSNISE